MTDERPTEPPRARVRVLLPLPLAGAYDYAVDGEVPAAGSFVRVPLGARVVDGVVWDGAGDAAVADAKLKAVIAVHDAPPLPDVSRRFIDWVAGYTMTPPGAVLRMAMSVPDALERLPPTPGLALGAAAPNPLLPEPGARRLTPSRARVLELLADGEPRAAKAIARDARVGTAVLRAMLAAGWLREMTLSAPPRHEPDGDAPGPALTDAQARAAAELVAAVGAGFSVTLVDGVTGAGKTEVYFEAIAAALRAGRQALVLLPEIAMSAQFLARFEARFGAKPASWHSEMNHRSRVRTWRDVAEGEARVVVGARSALFLPFAALGLIVVDEEHEAAFKQEDGVVYHARDMAVVRARLGAIPAALVSATPALETVDNVRRGRYRAVHLPERHGAAGLPAVELVDLRRDPPPPRHWLSPRLRDALAATLQAGEQALLFLNRRGTA